MAKTIKFPSPDIDFMGITSKPEKRVLFWTDNPLGFTGFGKVSREIIKQLLRDPDITYKIDVVGISFWGDRPDEPLGYTLYSALQPGQNIDLFGHAKLFSLLSTNDYDALFILNDLPVVARCLKDILAIREKQKKTFKIIHYFHVDGPVWPEEVRDSISKVDFPVAYTFFGRDTVAKHDAKLSDIPVIYHGTDKDMFRPFATEAERVSARKFWDNGASINSSKFIVLNVNRNQPRKDYAKTFEVFAEFHKRVPESYMFCMADPADIGGDLIRIAAQYGLVWGKDWWSAPVGSQTKSNGFPEEQIAQLYRISDVVISTSVGEGWGLSLTESQACYTSGLPQAFLMPGDHRRKRGARISCRCRRHGWNDHIWPE